MARKFKLEFSMDNAAFDDSFGGGEEVERVLSDILDAISGAHGSELSGPWAISDSSGNTIGHFEIVETEESEGTNG